jgi:SAM-dependent methyltransferase
VLPNRLVYPGREAATMALATRLRRSLGRAKPPRYGTRDLVDLAYRLVLGRPADPDGSRFFAGELESGRLDRDGFLQALYDSDEARGRRGRGEDGTTGRRWLEALHAARTQVIKGLPRASSILDLGGSAKGHPEGAMIAYGYPYKFESLTIIDLPRVERHPIYADICGEYTDVIATPQGPVRYVYTSMADLSMFADDSFDLVYSGQSIEHVSREDAVRTCQEVWRVLRPGGTFCLDTPNRAVTRLEFPDSWINPDHEYEYTHAELSAILGTSGFAIREAKGLALFAEGLEQGVFNYNEGLRHAGVYDDIERCYLLYYRCSKFGRSAGDER